MMFIKTPAGQAPIKVRVAKQDDFEELARIYAESSFAQYLPLHKALITPQTVATLAHHNVLLVAEVAGKVAGGIGMSAEKNRLTRKSSRVRCKRSGTAWIRSGKATALASCSPPRS